MSTVKEEALEFAEKTITEVRNDPNRTKVLRLLQGAAEELRDMVTVDDFDAPNDDTAVTVQEAYVRGLQEAYYVMD